MRNKILFLFFIFLTNSACNHLFYYPQKDVLYPPENLKIKYEPKEFISLDGTKLTGWFFPAVTGDAKNYKLNKNPKGTIIQFHGNAENMTSHYLSLVWLTREGYNLFTFDYRGYGKSEGEVTQQGTVEDGVSAIREVLKAHKNGVLITWGQSLGGAVLQSSLEKLSEEEKNKVSLIILDSTFSSYKTVAASSLRKNAVTWLISPLAYVLISDKFAAAGFYQENKTPVLIVHDELDNVVPYSNGEILNDKILGPKDFWHPRIGGHTRSFAPDQPSLRQKLVQFLSTTKKMANN